MNTLVVRTVGDKTVVAITGEDGEVLGREELDSYQAQQVGEAMFRSGRVCESKR